MYSGLLMKIIDRCFASVEIFSFSFKGDEKGCPFIRLTVRF